MGWLNEYPNHSCCREIGGTTPAMGWLKLSPNHSWSNDTGHTTLLTGWLNQLPNPRRWREGGKHNDSKAIPRSASTTNSWSACGQTIDTRLRLHTHPCRCGTDDHCHSSLAALCARFLLEVPTSNREPAGPARDSQFEPSWSCESCIPVRAFGRDHKLCGVSAETRTCKIGTLLHALQKSSEANCSSRVDPYQHFSPPSHAWFKAMMTASRHLFFPENSHGTPCRYARENGPDNLRQTRYALLVNAGRLGVKVPKIYPVNDGSQHHSTPPLSQKMKRVMHTRYT